MRFTLAIPIVALAVLTAAAPHPVRQNDCIAIPITKRSGLANADESIRIEALNSQVTSSKAYVVFFLRFASTLTSICSKVLRGLNHFQKNTGASHPAALKGTQRRATGADALTDDNRQLWYGSIFVGTPPNAFTGELFFCTVNERTTHSFWKWISTLARGTFL